MSVIPILTYHEILEDSEAAASNRPGLVVSKSAFFWQCLILKKMGFNPISLTQLNNCLITGGDFPKKSYIMTFDDGYEGVYKNGFEILSKFKIPGTLFLVAEDFTSHARPISERAFSILGKNQVQSMIDGGIEIGSHSMSHPDCTNLNESDLINEVAQSKRELEDIFDREITSFCFPFGEYNKNCLRVVMQTGYQTAVTTRFGRVNSASHRFALPRISVGSEINLFSFLLRFLIINERK